MKNKINLEREACQKFAESMKQIFREYEKNLRNQYIKKGLSKKKKNKGKKHGKQSR